MKFRNYKHMLEELSKYQEVLVTISLWTYSSKRMTYTVPYKAIRNCLNGDMAFKYNKQILKFRHKGSVIKHQLNTLKIAMVDYVEINDRDNYERCDVCSKLLDINKVEDFFVEDDTGSHVYCEDHWKAK